MTRRNERQEFWRPQEVRSLLKLLAVNPPLSYATLGERFARTSEAVGEKARSLGHKRRAKIKPWALHDIEQLRLMIDTGETLKDAAAKLERSPSAAKEKLRRIRRNGGAK